MRNVSLSLSPRPAETSRTSQCSLGISRVYLPVVSVRCAHRSRARADPLHNRILVEHDFELRRRQIAICLCIFRRVGQISGRGSRSSSRFTAAVPIPRISKAIPWFISLALRLPSPRYLSLFVSPIVFSRTARAVPIPHVVLSSRIVPRVVSSIALSLSR